MAKQERIEPGFFYTRTPLCAKGEHRWQVAAWTNVSTFRGNQSVMVTNERMTTREERMRDTENTSGSR